jgi:hypothetical protein
MGDHEVHKGHVVALERERENKKINKNLQRVICVF